MRDLPAPNKEAICKFLDISHSTGLMLSEAPRLIFVCFTNRCGSNYLCDLLASTHWFNRAQEWLNSDVVLERCQRAKITSLEQYVCEIARENAVSGQLVIKVAAEQLAMLLEAGVLDKVLEQSMFIWVQRADKLSQAVSLAIAEQNQQWAWYVPAQVKDNELKFSVERIAEHITWITTQNLAFDRFFAFNGLKPLPIFYESLIDHRTAIIDQIKGAVGQPSLVIDTSVLELKPQAGEINRQWRQAFLLSQSS
jgi:LPS sulfotransferase NodH